MAYSKERLRKIYERTNGQCHICRKKIAFKNYGANGSRGAWEVEHSKPRSKGGTDHGNNLYASCISCNRSKNNSSSKSARAKNGYKSAPYSEKQKLSNSATGAGMCGGLVWFLAPPQIKLPLAVFAALFGGSVGYNKEPN